LAQTMLVAPFDAGLNPMLPTSVIGACQTWIDANTAATPDRTYAVRRRLAGVDTDTTLTGLGTAARPLSEGLLGGFWTSTLANLDAAEIGAVKSGGGGAGGATLQANDLWLMCEYAPPTGEPPCNQSTATTTTTSTTSTTSTSTSSSSFTSTSSTTSTSQPSTTTSSTSTSTSTSSLPTTSSTASTSTSSSTSSSITTSTSTSTTQSTT